MINYLHLRWLKLYREILVLQFWYNSDVKKIDEILSEMRKVDTKVGKLERKE